MASRITGLLEYLRTELRDALRYVQGVRSSGPYCTGAWRACECKMRPYHTGDCRCSCGTVDSAGNALFEWAMRERGNAYMEIDSGDFATVKVIAAKGSVWDKILSEAKSER